MMTNVDIVLITFKEMLKEHSEKTTKLLENLSLEIRNFVRDEFALLRQELQKVSDDPKVMRGEVTAQEEKNEIVGMRKDEEGGKKECNEEKESEKEDNDKSVSDKRSTQSKKESGLPRDKYGDTVKKTAVDQQGDAQSGGQMEGSQVMGNVDVPLEAPALVFEGKMGLVNAAVAGCAAAIPALISKGANVRLRNMFGSNALHCAAFGGHREAVAVLLREAKKLIPTRVEDIWCRTALHLAASQGHVAVVKDLIRVGAIVEVKDAILKTPLLLAAQAGHTSAIQELLSAGSDILAMDKAGQTALHLAAKGGHIAALNCLLDRGADIRKVDNNEATALHFAVEEGHLSAVEILLHRGADIKAVDAKKYSPLHLAAIKGHAEILRFLQTRNADLTLQTPSKETALYLAAQSGHVGAVKVLVESGIMLDVTGQCALNALDAAGRGKHKEVVCLLIDASPGTGLTFGPMAMEKAIQNNLPFALKALLIEGADPNAKTSSGTCMLKYAMNFSSGSYGYGHDSFNSYGNSNVSRQDCVNALRESGANPQPK